jgi:hypothetical protein
VLNPLRSIYEGATLTDVWWLSIVAAIYHQVRYDDVGCLHNCQLSAQKANVGGSGFGMGSNDGCLYDIGANSKNGARVIGLHDYEERRTRGQARSNEIK